MEMHSLQIHQARIHKGMKDKPLKPSKGKAVVHKNAWYHNCNSIFKGLDVNACPNCGQTAPKEFIKEK